MPMNSKQKLLKVTSLRQKNFKKLVLKVMSKVIISYREIFVEGI